VSVNLAKPGHHKEEERLQGLSVRREKWIRLFNQSEKKRGRKENTFGFRRQQPVDKRPSKKKGRLIPSEKSQDARAEQGLDEPQTFLGEQGGGAAYAALDLSRWEEDPGKGFSRKRGTQVLHRIPTCTRNAG